LIKGVIRGMKDISNGAGIWIHYGDGMGKGMGKGMGMGKGKNYI
jgi:hypothetical protein